MPQLTYQDALKAAHLTDYKVGHVPIVGPWVSKVGHIIDIVQTPTNAGALLQVEGIFYATPKLVFLFTKPFLQAEELYRFTKARCGGKPRGKIQQFAKALGLSRYTGMISGELSPLTKIIFDVGLEFYLKATWYIMIVDYVTDFFYLSASLPMQWSQSPVDDEPHCLATTGPGHEFGDPLNTLFSGWTATDQNHGINCDFRTMTVDPGIGASVFATLNSLPDPVTGIAANISIWLVETESGTVYPRSTIQRTNADGSKSVATSVTYDGSTRTEFQAWQVYCTHDTNPFYCTGTFTGVGTRVGRKGLFFDP